MKNRLVKFYMSQIRKLPCALMTIFYVTKLVVHIESTMMNSHASSLVNNVNDRSEESLNEKF